MKGNLHSKKKLAEKDVLKQNFLVVCNDENSLHVSSVEFKVSILKSYTNFL